MSGSITGELLRDVSRSFYLSIRWLPAEMRRGVAIAYLLARATDSVADTAAAPEARRSAALRHMQAVIGGSSEELPQLMAELRGPLAPPAPAEARLLARFDEALAALGELPPAEAAPVRAVLDTIIRGQLWDLSFFREHTRVLSDEQTRDYTYRVAGCVGRFWTRLGLAVLGGGFCPPGAAAAMEEAGVRYGCGLQLVNILRDRAEDAARGRDYLCTAPEQWHTRAGEYLRAGIAYSRCLRSYRLRFASVLPALLGLRTLAALRRAEPGVRVKIPRRSVYAAMLHAALLALAPPQSDLSPRCRRS